MHQLTAESSDVNGLYDEFLVEIAKLDGVPDLVLTSYFAPPPVGEQQNPVHFSVKQVSSHACSSLHLFVFVMFAYVCIFSSFLLYHYVLLPHFYCYDPSSCLSPTIPMCRKPPTPLSMSRSKLDPRATLVFLAICFTRTTG